MMSEGLQIRLLGQMDVHADGVALPVIKRRKIRALLAYLAVARRQTVTREALSTLLWGDRSDTAAKASLRQTLFLLRQHLASGRAHYVRADGETISLCAVRTDVEALERLCTGDTLSDLREGVGLYRGPFLDDLTVREEPFEEWQRDQRARFHHLVADALERLASLQLDRADVLGAIGTGRRLLDLESARETGHRIVMRALALGGQRSAALEQYESCRRILAHELGIEPDTETRHLCEEIRGGSLARQGERTRHSIATSWPSPGAELERRQVTVMRCDLVGPSIAQLSSEPEQYRELLLELQRAAVRAVEPFSGYVARRLQDGLLVYFGYPRAHEDDPERAVRAGLAILDAADASQPEETTSAARIGIATGVVVAGESHGNNPEDGLVLGGPQLTAERLMAQSEPHSIVVSAATATLLPGRFELKATTCADDGSAYRVVSYVRRRSRFAGRAAQVLSPLVGRADELAALSRSWVQTGNGRGRVELVIGEAGIGKSRLLHEFVEQLVRERHELLLVQCSPFHQSSALHPFIAGLENLLEFTQVAERRRRLAAVRRHLHAIGQTDEQAVGLIGHLLGTTTLGDFRDVDAMDGRRRRERTLHALVDYASKLAARVPLVCVVEDVHWADPTTLELLTRLVERAEDEQVLIIATARPGFEAGWTDLGHVRVQSLSRLGEDASKALARAVASGRTRLPDEVLSSVIARSDGIPLFIEELTQAVLAGTATGPESTLAGLSEAVPIPLTLRDSLHERLDRLGDAKELAQVGAVIGREFTPGLVAAVVGRDEAWTHSRLERLADARLVYRRGSPPADYYVFKHALVREAAYDTLLAAQRKQLHARILDMLEDTTATRPEPEVLARHCVAAGRFDRAVKHSLEAAERSVLSWSLSEARHHFWRALHLLDDHPEIANRDERRVEVAIALARCSRMAGSPAHVDALERAVDHAESLGNEALLAEASFALATMYGAVGDWKRTISTLERCRQVAEGSGDMRLATLAESTLVRRRYLTGDIARSVAEVPRIVEKLERVGEDQEIVFVIGTVGNFAGWLGRFETGFRWAKQALRSAREAEDPSREAMSCLYLTMLHGTKGELSESLEYSRRGVELAELVGDRFTASITTALEGYFRYVLGHDSEGIAMQVESLEEHRLRGTQSLLGLHYAQLAECLALAGDSDRAEEFAERAIERGDAGETIGVSNAYLARALAAVQATPADWASVENWFTKAQSLATSRGERPLLGKIHFHRSLVQRTRGDLSAARTSSDLARALFEDMQMQWWVDAVRKHAS